METNTNENSNTYEVFRKHYDTYEQREQEYIVMIQRLMIENTRIKQENEKLKHNLKFSFGWR